MFVDICMLNWQVNERNNDKWRINVVHQSCSMFKTTDDWKGHINDRDRHIELHTPPCKHCHESMTTIRSIHGHTFSVFTFVSFMFICPNNPLQVDMWRNYHRWIIYKKRWLKRCKQCQMVEWIMVSTQWSPFMVQCVKILSFLWPCKKVNERSRSTQLVLCTT